MAMGLDSTGDLQYCDLTSIQSTKWTCICTYVHTCIDTCIHVYIHTRRFCKWVYIGSQSPVKSFYSPT